MSMLQDIFRDHYEEMIYTLHPRASVRENVEKMIHCGDPSFGGAMYGCPQCGKMKFVPFRCHSRFCRTCGNLYAMRRTTSMSFKQVKSRCYREHKDGFYVYAEPNERDPKTVVKYIGRYLGRPVMEFIERLIQHIPEKHYKMTRYGGLYARHREVDKKLFRAIPREKHRVYQSFNRWRDAILYAFGYDPLKCKCGSTMVFLKLYFNHKPVSLEEMYEKIMSRSRGKRSSA